MLLRLVALLRLSGSQFLVPSEGDMHFYNNWALGILKGTRVTPTAFYGLPLYPYLLAAIYKVCGYNPFVPGLLQSICDGGTAVLLYKLSSVVFGPSRGPRDPSAQGLEETRARVIGLLAGIGWAFFQPAQTYSVILMPTAGLVFVFWLVVWRILKTERLPPWWVLLSLGVLLGFTAMGVATILFLIPLLITAIFLRWKSSFRRGFVGALLVIAGVFIGASPAWAHNVFVARDPVFLSAHSGINFWIGNNPQANGYPEFPPGIRAGQNAMLQDSITLAEAAAGHPLKRSEVSAYWSRKAYSWIATHPIRWCVLLWKKFRNFWNAFQYDDLSVITILRDRSITLPGESFGLVAALGLPGLILAAWRVRSSRWISAAILLHFAALVPVFVTERYRLAAVPGLLLFAAYGLWELGRSLATARYRLALIFLPLVFCSTAFVSKPQRSSGLWALDPYNSGLAALEIHDLPLAREDLDRAYAYSPFNAEINFAQGNLRFALGDSDRAKDFYAAALRLNPQHVGAANNLGILALNEKHWKLAVQYFERALPFAPNDSKLRYLLARAELSSGNFAAASDAIAIALKLEPMRPEFIALQKEIELARSRP